MAESAISRPPSAREGEFVFLSELLGRPAWGPDGKQIGKVVDFLADAAEAAYPRVTALRIRSGELHRVDWADVADFDAAGARLKRGREVLQPLKLLANEIPLAQDVLDRQIVDTDDAKVERVNDLHLLRARGDLRVAHVDVGFRGLVRRMGWQPLVGAKGRISAVLSPPPSSLTRPQLPERGGSVSPPPRRGRPV